jgi:Fe-S-cluster containining protein
MKSFPVLNDIYHFECTKCGNCCCGDISITLNLYDLYKMARFLNIKTTKELFNKNYVRLSKHEHNVWIPEIQFKRSPLKFCPFLINDADDKNYNQGLCSLHPEHKPLICSLAPVGRIVDFYDDSDEYVFIKPATDCPGVDSKIENKLSEKIAKYDIELCYQKRFFKILEELKDSDYSKAYYQERLYSFSVNIEFDKIIQSIENKLLA